MRQPRTPPGRDHETALAARAGGPVAGVDEAGRGPWAGPVVAAAVVLGPGPPPSGVNDSKVLSAAARGRILVEIEATALIGVGTADVEEIDALNILGATDLAMRRALEAVCAQVRLAGALIDGARVPPGLPVGLVAEALPKGDARSAAIAAASIVAKVTRDRIMDALARTHRGYGWETNRGYGTAGHRAALHRLGVTSQHRRSFRPIHQMLYEDFPTDS